MQVEDIIHTESKIPYKNKKSEVINMSKSNKIFSLDGTSVKATAKDLKKRETLLELTESKKAKKILTGTIQGVEKYGDKIAAIIFYKGFKIIIPSQFLINITPVPNKSEDQWPEYLTSKRLGSEVDFVIEQIDEENEVAVANRFKAMEIKRKTILLAKEPDGSPRIPVDSIVEARVVCATRAGAFVEVFGAECFIPSRELSYQRIQDAANDFPVGSTVYVKLTSVGMEDGKCVITASAKQAIENPYKKAMQTYEIDNKYIGEVSMVDEHGVFVALGGGVDALCPFPKRGVRPTKGTKVTVRITVKNEEMERIFGTITHISTVQ